VAFVLSFLLPDGVTADSGSFFAAADRCTLKIDRGCFVEIRGPSREAVFDRAATLLRGACRGHGPKSILALLTTPGRAFSASSAGGRDDWTIIIGADIAFAPTAIDPHLPAPPAASGPLVLVQGGRAQ
jgi:hypothetical protein